MNNVIGTKLHKAIGILAAVLAMALILVSCKKAAPTEMSRISAPSVEGPYSVTRTVDGDTIVVNIDGVDTKIRLIGIDAPESVHPDEEKNTEEGRIASEYTEKLLSDTDVYLEYDSEYRDAYDRVLAYVYLEDGRMVNEILLEEGMATVYTVPPNTKYSENFLAIQGKARKNCIGFWAEK